MFSILPFYHGMSAPFGGLEDDMWRPRSRLNITESDRGHTRRIEPTFTVESDEDGAHFEIELPGVCKEDISIEAENNTLTVSAKRFKKHRTGKDDTVVEEEGNDGAEATKHPATKKDVQPSIIYMLQARLGNGADVDAIKADVEGDGILYVTVPLKKGNGPRRIQIPI